MWILTTLIGAVTVSAMRSVYDPLKTSSLDPSSYANIDFIRTYNFNLEMNVNFDQQVISATNYLSMIAIQDTSEIILDFQGLKINSVQYQLGGSIDYNIAYYETWEDEQLGSAIKIYVTDKIFAGMNVTVKVQYDTTPDSLSFNWLSKEQTASQTLQYLYTKCEPIHCRAIAPLQDTPAIKTKY